MSDYCDYGHSDAICKTMPFSTNERLYRNIARDQKLGRIIQISTLAVLVIGILGLVYFSMISDKIRFFKDIKLMKTVFIVSFAATISFVVLTINSLVQKWIKSKKALLDKNNPFSYARYEYTVELTQHGLEASEK